MHFRALLPPMLRVARACVAAGDEDVAVATFETLGDLCASPAPVVTAGPVLSECAQVLLAGTNDLWRCDAPAVAACLREQYVAAR